MINCRVIFVNGPINSGKSTIAKMLSEQIPDAVYLEGDDIVSRKELSQAKWIIATIMTGTLKGCELAHEGKLAIFAFPLRDNDWKVVSGLCEHAGVIPICVTLDPGIETALSNRDQRELSDQEKQRIQEMYEEGYHQRSFSSLTVNNADESPSETCERIRAFIDQSSAPALH